MFQWEENGKKAMLDILIHKAKIDHKLTPEEEKALSGPQEVRSEANK